ncbi:amino acid ABC transporter permease [Roseovarius sp.]|uniref:amino acid ABC transporter permease n=1 Tax=Roseovarius sp. TaxID=1486281 RepID=UPI0035675B1D
MDLDFSIIQRNAPLFLEGFMVTIELSLLAIVFSLLWGLPVVVARLSPFAPLCILARSYLEAVRNTPVLVQMYFIYFGSGIAGYPISGYFAGLLALTLQNGGYISEIYRAGIQSIDRGQREAGAALGMLPLQIFRIVVFPQAIRRVIPPISNQGVIIIKDTSLVSALSVAELTYQSKILADRTAATYEIFITLAIFYIVITTFYSGALRLIEGRFRVLQ